MLVIQLLKWVETFHVYFRDNFFGYIIFLLIHLTYDKGKTKKNYKYNCIVFEILVLHILICYFFIKLLHFKTESSNYNFIYHVIQKFEPNRTLLEFAFEGPLSLKMKRRRYLYIDCQ